MHQGPPPQGMLAQHVPCNPSLQLSCCFPLLNMALSAAGRYCNGTGHLLQAASKCEKHRQRHQHSSCNCTTGLSYIDNMHPLVVLGSADITSRCHCGICQYCIYKVLLVGYKVVTDLYTVQ